MSIEKLTGEELESLTTLCGEEARGGPAVRARLKAIRIIDQLTEALVAQLEVAKARRADEQRVLDAVEKAYDWQTANHAWREVFDAERARRKKLMARGNAGSKGDSNG